MNHLFERLITRTPPILLEIAAGFLVLVGAVCRFLDMEPAAKIAFLAAVALGTLGGGWRAGALWMVPSGLSLLSNISNGRRIESALECLAAYLIFGLTREVILRLRRSQAKLEAMLAPMADVILTLDRDGTYVDVAPTSAGLLLRPASELIGRNIAEFVPPDVAAKYVSEVRRALARESTVRFDYDLDIGGETVWFSAHLTPVFDDKVVWVARNITAQKTAELELQRSYAELEERVRERTLELETAVVALQEQERRQAEVEDALRSSEWNHRSIVEQASDIICTITPDGTILTLNAAFQRILGWKAEEWIGRKFLDLVVADRRGLASRALAAAVTDRGLAITRTAATARNGSRVTLETSLVAQLHHGALTGFILVARDVTAREREEQNQKWIESQLRESQAIAKLGSWIFEFGKQTVWWSDQQYLIFGVAPDTPLTPGFHEQFLDEQGLASMREVLAILETSDQHSWELDIHLHDGTRKTVRCLARIDSEHGRRVRAVGTVQDITESKAAEERLRRSEERFRFISRATNDAVWEWDLETNLVWRSEGFLQSPDERSPVIIDLDSWKVHIHPDDVPRVVASLVEAVESGQDVWAEEYRIKRADGSYAIVFDRGYIQRDANRRAKRVTGAMSDITERKLLEDQLAHTRRVHSLGRVAASIAHEFNNVLMGVQPNLELVRRHAVPQQSVPLTHILQSVLRGKRITDEILRFTRPSDPELACVGVADLLRTWKSGILPLAGEGIEIEIECDETSDLFMHADPLQISQILTNLALNARDAMQGNGRIHVTASLGKSFSSYGFGVVKTPDGYVHIRIADAGTGMSKETLAHVFEPLFTTKRGGTGLGLAVSYQLVLRHLGHMFVESEPGVGTTFHLMIPATHPVVAPQLVPANDPLPIKRILIVEDEPAVASGIKALLELDDFEVEVATTGEDAVPAATRFRPDAVILDIGLPDINGAVVYAELDRLWPHLPVLFSSGHANPAELDDFLQRQHVGLLTKPYDYDRLRDALRPLLETAAARSAVA